MYTIKVYKATEMGILDKMFGNGNAVGEAPELESVMEELKNMPDEPADFYIAKIDLRNDGDADTVLKALSQQKIILLNILPLVKQPNRLRNMLGKFKSHVLKTSGDMALLNQEMVILCPAKVKIIKAKVKKQ